MSDAPTPEELLAIYEQLAPYQRAVHRQQIFRDALKQGGPTALAAMRLRRFMETGDKTVAPSSRGNVVTFPGRA